MQVIIGAPSARNLERLWRRLLLHRYARPELIKGAANNARAGDSSSSGRLRD